MEHFEIQPVLSSALCDVADFLHRWRSNEAANKAKDPAVQQYAGESARSIERRLQWLLLENPAATEGFRFGYCLRDGQGVIRGLNLAFPAVFLSSEQRLLGLCSGSFFVEPAARSLGFYLFKKYLASPSYCFFFATNCNASSAELWSRLGGSAVPNSQMEYVLPLKLDVVIPAFLAAAISSKAALKIARIYGRCANPVWRLRTRSSAELMIERCQDWEKLSNLFRRHCPAGHITSDRSAEFLKWKYGPGSPVFPCSVYLFRDQSGNEGWFCLGNVMRGKEAPIRGCVLLEAIWPREKMSFKNIFEQILRVAATEADAIFLRAQPGLDYREYSAWIVSRRFDAPRAFVIAPKGAPTLRLDLLDLGDSDDSAWSFRWTAAREQLDCVRSRCAAPSCTEKEPEGVPR